MDFKDLLNSINIKIGPKGIEIITEYWWESLLVLGLVSVLGYFWIIRKQRPDGGLPLNPKSADIDIYRSANILIEHHGKGAIDEASRHEAAMLAKGDLDGVKVWQAVARAIQELQRTPRPTDKVLH